MRRLLKIGVPVLVLLGFVAGASAYWATHGSGAGAATVATLSAPAGVNATASGTTVALSWTGSALSQGTPAEGYYVTRTNTSSSTTSPACSSSAASPISGTSCSDEDVPDGSYTYTVVAVYRSWSEASTPSNEVTVQGDTTAPSITMGFPSENGVYKASSWNAGCAPNTGLCGTASDASGVSSVEVSIFQESTNRYWNGTAFAGTSEAFHTATGTSAWRANLPLPSTDGAYTVHVRATDGVGNTTSPGDYIVRHFTVDTTAPTATVVASSSTNVQPITYEIAFSEPVTDLAAAGVTVAAPAANTGVTKSVSKTDSQHFTVSVGGLKTDGTGDGTVSVQVNAGAVADGAGNGNAASNTAGVSWDRTVPTRSALEFLDANGNGKVDQVRITYNEALGSYTAGTAPWTLANVPSGGSLSSVGVSGTAVILNLTEGSGAASTSGTSFTAAYTAPGSGGTKDAAGNAAASFSATAVSDKAAPAVTALEMLDSNTNGKVNQLKATFSETLASYTAGTGPWTLADVPSGGSLSSVAVSGTIATLTLAEGAAAADTSVGSFTVALGSSATGIRDAAGNQSTFAAQAPSDKAGPVPTGLVDTDGTVNGKLEQSDTMTVSFSENVIGAGTSSNVALTGANGSNNDTVTMSGVGTGNLGRSDYISGNGSVANFNGSVVSQPASNQVRVILAACTGACANLPAGGAAAVGNFAFTPATTITDAAANPAAGSITVSIRLF